MNKENAKLALTIFLGASILFNTSALTTYVVLTHDKPEETELKKEIIYTEWVNDEKIKIFLRDTPYEADGIQYNYIEEKLKEENGKTVRYFVFEEVKPNQTKQIIEVKATFTKVPKNTETEQYIIDGYNEETGDLIYQKQKRYQKAIHYIKENEKKYRIIM